MKEMFITPMKFTQGVQGIQKENTNNQMGKGFESILNDAITNVKESESELSKQQYLLATGQTDDAHAVPIAAAKAQLSVDLLVQIRNKALESYNELMRINL